MLERVPLGALFPREPDALPPLPGRSGEAEGERERGKGRGREGDIEGEGEKERDAMLLPSEAATT